MPCFSPLASTEMKSSPGLARRSSTRGVTYSIIPFMPSVSGFIRSDSPRKIEQLLGELADVGPIGFGNAHHLGDYQNRERGRQIPHHVHSTFVLDRIEQVLDRLPHERPPLLQGLWREVAVDDLAHLQMARTVILNELVAQVIAYVFVKAEVRLIDCRIGWSRVVLEDSGREQLVMPGQPD